MAEWFAWLFASSVFPDPELLDGDDRKQMNYE